MNVKKGRLNFKKKGTSVKDDLSVDSFVDNDGLYPKGVDPSLVDEEHNSRGQWSPYSEKQRKAAAVLSKRYQSEGMTLVESLKKAFSEVGEPELIDEVTGGSQHKINKKSGSESRIH